MKTVYVFEDEFRYAIGVSAAGPRPDIDSAVALKPPEREQWVSFDIEGVSVELSPNQARQLANCVIHISRGDKP